MALVVITQSQIGASPSSVLLIIGVFLTIFSLIIGLLVLFVIPDACTFVDGLELRILIFLFLLEVTAFSVGTALPRKKFERSS